MTLAPSPAPAAPAAATPASQAALPAAAPAPPSAPLSAAWPVAEAPASACFKFRLSTSMELLYTFRGSADAELQTRIKDTLPLLQEILDACEERAGRASQRPGARHATPSATQHWPSRRHWWRAVLPRAPSAPGSPHQRQGVLVVPLGRQRKALLQGRRLTAPQGAGR